MKATTLVEMKGVWRGRKFSFIHEARPTDKNLAFFMQTLYDRAIKDLEKLNSLVVEAKYNDVGVAVAVVKKMLAKNMFLFGFVQVDEESVSKTVNDITKKQDCYLRVASKTLLSNVPAQEHCHMNLMEDLKLGELRNLAKEYARAKELVIMEASAMQGIGELLNAEAEHRAIVGEDLERIAEGWNQQRQLFYEQNGLKEPSQNKTTDDFAHELDELLSGD